VSFFSTYGPAALTSQTQTATWAIPCHWLCNSSGQNSKGNVEHQKTKQKKKNKKEKKEKSMKNIKGKKEEEERI
jgi:hypothetical protein